MIIAYKNTVTYFIIVFVDTCLIEAQILIILSKTSFFKLFLVFFFFWFCHPYAHDRVRKDITKADVLTYCTGDYKNNCVCRYCLPKS